MGAIPLPPEHDVPHISQPRRLSLLAILVALGAVVGGCGDDARSSDSTKGDQPSRERGNSATAATKPPALRLQKVGTFDAPVHAVPVPGTDLVAVVEKGGRVRMVAGMVCAAPDNCPTRPVTAGREALDIADEVSTGSEQGLLGLAFHPDWPSDPRIFINYTDTEGDTRIEAWTLDGPAARATRDRELLRVKQPYENHNGGHLAFGPDGLLYIAMGDGGSSGDPEDRAQSVDEQLGKLLRIDVEGGGERGYRIPEGNARDGAPEVWAVGLRNPWRFSFDAASGDLWIGDVGQDSFEEVDAVPRATLGRSPAPNFGWRRKEGFQEFDTSGATGPGPVVDPVLAYGRDDGCSITGGVVYRGRLVPALRGWYMFADFCQDDLRLVRAEGVPGSRRTQDELKWFSTAGAGQVASFGEVQRGEVLLVSLDGTISQVLPK